MVTPDVEAAAHTLAGMPAADRAAVMHRVADALDSAAGELVPLAAGETRLPAERLTGELARTTFQLRLYADEIASGRPLRQRHDAAAPAPLPRPDLFRTAVPIGPVVVFAASNFPFAFSVLGTDTAAALAAGCPVVVKAHPGHPRLSDRVREIAAPLLPPGALTLVHGEEEGREVLLDPRIKAAAFTGSLAGGRALFDLAASRPEPIPFYGELGSVNPVFVTRSAAERRGPEIWAGFAESYTLGLGQFCTKPGVLILPGSALDAAATAVAGALSGHPGGDLLTSKIADGFRAGRPGPSARVVFEGPPGEGRFAAPALYATTAGALRDDPEGLLEERFGPSALLVAYDDEGELPALARLIPGQLTATVHGEEDDEVAPALVRGLAGLAGRVIWNGWPTGVAVTGAMHHGGPYPATTAPLHTSVGTAAIERFLRPVTFQNMPAAILTTLPSSKEVDR
ncbi:aldehyde dehydrogenase [Paractinoplanes deccanensis]|uniref:Aldehyde dehydrogenase n=1 Tax=Paractinoplanes deccanensis TaxID=113561 RepID=A0ABQ3YK13_9ACTN|nr:aldehyde dehydrogenase family protein [Actinoplanes deccanensis]GID80354.1 aldehyde dehydrogenase [Actinoplanes deccanensis]